MLVEKSVKLFPFDVKFAEKKSVEVMFSFDTKLLHRLVGLPK